MIKVQGWERSHVKELKSRLDLTWVLHEGKDGIIASQMKASSIKLV
jgi:hypothetical protein